MIPPLPSVHVSPPPVADDVIDDFAALAKIGAHIGADTVAIVAEPIIQTTVQQAISNAGIYASTNLVPLLPASVQPIGQASVVSSVFVGHLVTNPVILHKATTCVTEASKKSSDVVIDTAKKCSTKVAQLLGCSHDE